VRQPFIGLLQSGRSFQPAAVRPVHAVVHRIRRRARDAPLVLLFWKGIYPQLTRFIAQPYLFFVDIYYDWQWAMLFLSPFLYLAIYVFFVWIMKIVHRQSKERARPGAAICLLVDPDRVRL